MHAMCVYLCSFYQINAHYTYICTFEHIRAVHNMYFGLLRTTPASVVVDTISSTS